MKQTGEMGCSCLAWAAEEGGPLWGRNFDLNVLPPDTQVTFLPPGTAYAPCGAGTAVMESRWGVVGVGTLAVPGAPMLYEGVNQMGLMGGQLNYRGFACYPDAPQDGTSAVPPGGVVYHLLARCASVAEAAEVLEREVTITAVPLLGTVPTVHWAFTDETGESMVVEPEADGLRIYRNALGVLTNSPGYPWQRMNLLNYAGVRDLDRDILDWGEGLMPCFSGTGGQGLPGDWSSPSRFVRLAFLRRYAGRGAPRRRAWPTVPPAAMCRLSFRGGTSGGGTALGVYPLFRRCLCPVQTVLLDHLRKSAGAVCGPALLGRARGTGPFFAG